MIMYFHFQNRICDYVFCNLEILVHNSIEKPLPANDLIFNPQLLWLVP